MGTVFSCFGVIRMDTVSIKESGLNMGINDVRLTSPEIVRLLESVGKASEAHLVDKAKTSQPNGINRLDENFVSDICSRFILT